MVTIAYLGHCRGVSVKCKVRQRSANDLFTLQAVMDMKEAAPEEPKPKNTRSQRGHRMMGLRLLSNVGENTYVLPDIQQYLWWLPLQFDPLIDQICFKSSTSSCPKRNLHMLTA